MARFETTPDTPLSATWPVEERVTTFLRAVYGWMCGGLAITAVTASVIASSPAFVIAVATNRLLFWGLMIAQLGIVFVLSARVQHLAASTAALLFIAYSALTGVTISFVLLAFTGNPSPRRSSSRPACLHDGVWHDHAAQFGGFQQFW
jgi:FtsH-binding integral membrane protein